MSSTDTTTGHDHAGHDHAGHDHAGHDHAGHDHAGHDHAGHDHAGVSPTSDADTAEAAEAVTSRPRSTFQDVEVGEDGMPDAEILREGLKAVLDPEIGYNIVDLGLVYEVLKPEPGHAHVRMTLTAMGCPLTEVIHQQVSMVMLAFPGVESADVEFTFSPPWSPDMMADYVREELRAMGMNV